MHKLNNILELIHLLKKLGNQIAHNFMTRHTFILVLFIYVSTAFFAKTKPFFRVFLVTKLDVLPDLLSN